MLSLLILLFSCRTQCEGIGCTVETISSSLLVFLTPEAAQENRLTSQASMTIEGSQAHKTAWGVSIDSQQNMWLGTADGSIYSLPLQIGTISLEEQSVNHSSAIEHFGKQLIDIEAEHQWSILGSPYQDYSASIQQSGSITIYQDHDFSAPVTEIMAIEPLGHFPSRIWKCGDLDLDGTDDWIASTSSFAILGLSSIWLDSTASTIELSDFPHRYPSQEREGFAQKIDCSHDVDENGTIDIVIASPFWQNENGGTGKLDIFQNGWSNTPYSWTGTTAQTWFGYSFAIGDLNADSINDWSVLSFSNSTATVEVYAQNDLSFQLETFVESPQDGSFFGKRQEMIDLNLDGKMELVITDPFYSSDSLTEVGRIFIFQQAPNFVNFISLQLQTITGDQEYQRLGERIYFSDLNQDQQIDIISPILVP